MCAQLQKLLKPEEKISLEREIANALPANTTYGNRLVLIQNEIHIINGRTLIPLKQIQA